jgi:hypothetical protein
LSSRSWTDLRLASSPSAGAHRDSYRRIWSNNFHFDVCALSALTRSAKPFVACSARVLLNAFRIGWVIGFEHCSLKLWPMGIVPCHRLLIDGLYHVVNVSRSTSRVRPQTHVDLIRPT